MSYNLTKVLTHHNFNTHHLEQNKQQKSNPTTNSSLQLNQQNNRPALQALNKLNQQLQYQNQQKSFIQRIHNLQQQNKTLHQTIHSLQKQLDVQKKLRKYAIKQGNKMQIMEAQQMQAITNKLYLLKSRYIL